MKGLYSLEGLAGAGLLAVGHDATVSPGPLEPGRREAAGDAVQSSPLALHHRQLLGGAVLQPHRGPHLELHLLSHLLVDAHHHLEPVLSQIIQIFEQYHPNSTIRYLLFKHFSRTEYGPLVFSINYSFCF